MQSYFFMSIIVLTIYVKRVGMVIVKCFQLPLKH